MTKLTMNDAIDLLWYYGINTALDLEEVRIQYQAATDETAHGVRESHLDPLERGNTVLILTIHLNTGCPKTLGPFCFSCENLSGLNVLDPDVEDDRMTG